MAKYSWNGNAGRVLDRHEGACLGCASLTFDWIKAMPLTGTPKRKSNMRVNIPSNPDYLIALAKAINAKHTALGAASPLNGIEGIAGFGAQVTAADTNNQLAGQLYKQAETATEARDNALGPDTTTPGYVRFYVTAARDVLAALNKGSEHKLGDWGFEVDATAQATAEQKAALKAAKAAAKNKPATP